MPNCPKISIITPSYNQAQYIEQNILSVLNQNYPNFEHIVIDGGSSDETVEVLKRYPHLKWVSEKDRGQSDALNKGFKLVTGDIVGWINSDDFYEDGIFDTVAGAFEASGAEWLIGDLSFLYQDEGLTIPKTSPTVTYRNLLKNPDIVRQQPTFFKRSAIERAGGWNQEFYMVMDYDLWLRLAKGADPLMLRQNLAYFRFHGEQKSVYKNFKIQMIEICRLMKREDAVSPHLLLTLAKKSWYMLKGYVKSHLLRVGLLPQRFASRPIRVTS